MFAAASNCFVEAVGADIFRSLDSVEEADNCQLLNVVVKKTRLLRKDKYALTNFSLQEILKSSNNALDVEKNSHELVQYVRTSKISVSGSLGVNILKQVSIDVSGKESLELISNLGQVDKNDVTIESLCNALQGRRVNMKNDLVKMVSEKGACLCVIMETANIANDGAVVSCQEEGQVAVGASVTSAATAGQVEGTAAVGASNEMFNQLTLAKGLSLAYNVIELQIQSNGVVKVVRVKGEKGGFVPAEDGDDVDEGDDDEEVEDNNKINNAKNGERVRDFLQEAEDNEEEEESNKKEEEE